ncbi:MAG: type II toxin-antitoxin system VapC family toxin [Candidatus Bathyarchaeia archaeon]
MEITQAVIDTDILIDLLRNVESVVDFIREMENRGTHLSTTIINAFELYHGAYKSRRREENLSATRKLLGRLTLLTMGSKSAQTAARIYAELEAAGQPIGLRDVFIGAITLTRGYTLVTRNIEHLKRVPGLSVTPAP